MEVALFKFVDIIEGEFLGNSLVSYLNSLLFIILCVILIIILKRIAKQVFKKRKQGKFDLGYMFFIFFDSLSLPLYLLFLLYFSTFFLVLEGNVSNVLKILFIILVFVFIIRLFVRMLKFLTNEYIELKEKQGEKVNRSFMHFLRNIIIGILWTIGLIILFSNLGVDVTALVTGLGIGGIAVALAIQNILGDVFSSISIFLDKPFEEGDFIVIGSDAGVIKKIGVKTTRIQTLQGEELVIANKELVSQRIHNFKKLEKRRVVFNIGVTYGTPVDKLKTARDIIEKVIDYIELAKLDRVHFSKFGDFALSFETVYYVNVSDYKKYMDIQQEINLRIIEEFNNAGIEMAFPTQTLYLKKED